MRDPEAPHSARATAKSMLLDRGYGKPVQQIESGDPGAFDGVSDAELDAAALDIAHRLVNETRH